MNTLKNLSILLVLFAFIALAPTLPIHAQGENNSETEEVINDTDSPTASESIKDIKKIIKENIENNKVKGAINNLLNRKIAMIGQITRITDDAITIKNISGTKILALDSNPKITKDNKVIDVERIEVENWTMVLGKLKDDNFSPHFIFIFSKTLRPKTQVVLIGTITSISKSEIKITPRSGNEETILKLSTNTNYQDYDGEKASLNNFSEDINVLITGFENNNGFTAATLKSLA